MKVVRIFIISFLCVFRTYGEGVDSLKRSLISSRNAEQKLSVLFALSERANSMSIKEAMQYAEDAYTLSRQLKNDNAQSQSLYYYASALQKNGMPDRALQIVQQQLPKLEAEKQDNGKNYRRFLHLQGTLMVRKNRYKEGIAAFYKLLNYGERNKDTQYQVIAERGIGWVYMEMNNYPLAFKWSHKALRTDVYGSNKNEYILIYSNMAAMFNNMNKYDSAEYYTEKAIIGARESHNLAGIANALNIKVGYLMPGGRKAEAEQCLKDALSIRSQIGDPFYIISDMDILAEYYLANKEPQKSIAICKQAIDSALKYNIPAKLPLLYTSLAKAYKSAGDVAQYSATLEQLITLSDSLYKKNTADALAEIQAKYDLQKKDNIIISQQLMLTRNKYRFYGSVLFALFAVSFSIILFRNYRKKQKLRLGFLLENEKLRSTQAVKEAEENERKRIAADLHDSLGAYAASIASNIDHITHEQGKGENGVILGELKANSQAIVSQLGDTIWALKKDTLSLTEISDRLKVFINRTGRSYPQISIEVDECIVNDVQLVPSQAFHLYCIVQESVINALRHSNCSQINITIESDNAWEVCIADDGDGMKASQKQMAAGNGLFNMRARAEASGWTIIWEKGATKGTVVCVKPNDTTTN